MPIIADINKQKLALERKSIALRVSEAVKSGGGNASVSAETCIPLRTLANYMAGESDIKASAIARISEATGKSLDWLLRGRETSSDCSFALIPRYDAVLSAGDGAFNERAQILDEIPFTKEFLKKRMGRSSTKGLVMLNISGDSMDPTITDGDLVMVDCNNKKIADGIFAFVDDGDALVKRFRRTIGGGFDVISDNKDVYPPEHLSQDNMNRIDIIGRVCWVGRSY